jgi:chromosome segregation ATPase
MNLTSYRNGSGAPKPDLEVLALDDKLRDEMKRLSEVNNELLGKSRSHPAMAVETVPNIDHTTELREENAKMRRRVAELEGLLEELLGNEDKWGDQKKEFEAILEEKSEVIRGLYLKVQELQEGASTGAASKAAENAEIKKLRAELEEQRAQIERDEEALMQQMRQMEMAMSRDRAELARQRNEMQRMQADLSHEIEMAARDPGLREKLMMLQRRQQETLARKGGAASAPQPAKDTPEAAPAADNIRKSGFFGRLFGK